MHASGVYPLETENGVENMPEWKKKLIMKKRAGSNHNTEDHARNNLECDVLKNGINDIVNNKNCKFNGTTKLTEISPLKTVTIGKINVELRSVQTCLQEDISSGEGSEDFQYGPGIVDRLRAKFLNIGVKQTSKPVVRRFSSLENLPGSQKFNPRNARYNHVKKALSMETLICNNTSEYLSGRRPNARAVGGVKARILSRVLSDENDKPKDKSPKLFHHALRRWEPVTAPNINEDELPKPDTVKHVKKIFESPPPAAANPEKLPKFRRVPNTALSSLQGVAAPKNNNSSIIITKEEAKVTAICAKESPKVNSFLESEEDEINELADNSVVLLAGDNLSTNKSCDTLENESCDEIIVPAVLKENERVISPMQEQSQYSNQNKTSSDELDTPPTPPPRSGSAAETMLISSDGKASSFSTKGTSWQKDPLSTTSIVFDFRGRNDVEPHISLNPTPFGCKPAKVSKRSGSPPRACDADEDLEDWDDMDIGADLPAVSGIVFTGENVKVGRGALLEIRNKKLNIQFDDKAISTFEYPSENASPKEEFDIECPANSRLGLSNYTPQFLCNNKEFELGVSQSSHRSVAISHENEKQNVPLLDIIIPSDSNDTVGWSASETADILF